MPKKIIAVLLSVLVIVTAFALPTFAAEDEAAAAPSVDWSKYPTMNLITFPYVNSTVSNGGLNWSVQDDFGVAVKGEITGYSQFTLAEIPLASDTTYTFNLGRTVLSCGITAEIILLDSLGVSVSKIYVSLQREFVSFSTADYDNVVSARISLLRQSSGLSTNVVDCVIYPMFNVGSEPYPFSPYMPYLLEQQYNNGYSSGEAAGNQAGYDKGYGEGYNDAMGEIESMNYGVFEKAAFVATLTGSHPSTGVSYKKTFEFIPNFVFSGVFFSSLYDQINMFLISYGDEYWEYVDRVEIEMVWINDNVFDYRVLPLYISGDFDVNFGTLYTTSGEAFELDASDYTTGEKRIFQVLTDTVDPLMVNRIMIRVGRPADLLTAFTLYSPSESYSDGYSDGYASGYHEGESVGYINGGNAIYKEAFNKGKEEGLLLSEDGSWRSLMLAVTEAPINTFQSLFNFEILGMDMRAAFGSILAVCVVLIIVKKVVL